MRWMSLCLYDLYCHIFLFDTATLATAQQLVYCSLEKVSKDRLIEWKRDNLLSIALWPLFHLLNICYQKLSHNFSPSRWQTLSPFNLAWLYIHKLCNFLNSNYIIPFKMYTNNDHQIQSCVMMCWPYTERTVMYAMLHCTLPVVHTVHVLSVHMQHSMSEHIDTVPRHNYTSTRDWREFPHIQQSWVPFSMLLACVCQCLVLCYLTEKLNVTLLCLCHKLLGTVFPLQKAFMHHAEQHLSCCQCCSFLQCTHCCWFT